MMPCEHVKLPGGIAGIACTGRRPRRRCSCGSGELTTLLCDHPKPRGGTCDRNLCTICAVEVGPDRHHCPSHPEATASTPTAPARPRQGELEI